MWTMAVLHRGRAPSRISPESCFESPFYTRRFGPHESTYIRRFENRDPSRLQTTNAKNRPKQFQIEMDSQKGVPFLADRVVNLLPRWVLSNPANRYLGSYGLPQLISDEYDASKASRILG